MIKCVRLHVVVAASITLNRKPLVSQFEGMYRAALAAEKVSN